MTNDNLGSAINQLTEANTSHIKKKTYESFWCIKEKNESFLNIKQKTN